MTSTNLARRPVERKPGRPVEWSVDEGPVIIRAGASDWPLTRTCASGRLIADHGQRTLTAVRRAPATGDGPEPETVWGTTLREFLRYCESGDGSPCPAGEPWYVKDWTVASEPDPGAFLPADMPSSLRNWFARLPQAARPAWEWIYVGPRGSGSELHVDVMMSSAWNALAAGTKRWRFLSPAASVRAGVLPEPYLDLVGNRDRLEFECTQNAGDLVIIPSGWAHEVVNLDTTVAATGNFVNRGNAVFARRHLETRGRAPWLKVLGALEHDEGNRTHAA
ncbi:cupin-like domain-containing protein [Streptomyces sp. L2]|uniref:cupin-like domain-containing protein n=1 Tax=Streptomyces sp. L2 TaxID=2162665 RepID=UPI0010112B11|nr:cupin-like domain-containing protein [Streptomyces sp. L2]